MEVVILADADAVAAYVADAIVNVVGSRPMPVLGLATGSSPLGVYAELVRRHRAGMVSFHDVRAFLLDEYIGLPTGHPESYRAFIDTHFAGLVDIDATNVHVPGAGAAEEGVSGAAIADACVAYEADIRAAGGVDLQLLGTGADGHLGFNEPTSSLASRTRVKTLTEQTRRDNARFFGSPDDVPMHVITMGVGSIMDARQVLLLAFGESKAHAIAAAIEGPISAMNPASMLQMHPVAKALIDEPAASRLTLNDYYRWVYDHKPQWQRFVRES